MWCVLFCFPPSVITCVLVWCGLILVGFFSVSLFLFVVYFKLFLFSYLFRLLKRGEGNGSWKKTESSIVVMFCRSQESLILKVSKLSFFFFFSYFCFSFLKLLLKWMKCCIWTFELLQLCTLYKFFFVLPVLGYGWTYNKEKSFLVDFKCFHL